MTTAHHVGFVLGPSIGGFMIDYFSWRWSYFFLVPMGLCGTALAVVNIKRRRRSARRHSVSIDYLGAALLFAITSTLVVILDRRAQQMFTGSIKAGMALLFLGSLVGFLLHESRAKTSL
jgi:MFS family permease